MDDEEFTPRLGRMRRRGKEAGYLALVVKAARVAGRRAPRRGGFDGSRIGRGAGVARVLRSRDRHSAFRSRRAVVKFRLATLGGRGAGGAKAHLKYIERDGVTREGSPGQLYSAETDIADGREFLSRSGGDRHQFRLIVSLEDGDQYTDLKPFVRRMMDQMEKDLGTRLDWVAVDHFNTGHPHSHIILRGRNDRGDDLVIAREYISHGARERAAEIATLDLGPRTELEIEARLRAETGAERLTGIDRQLIADMDEHRIVSASAADAFRQALRTGRLQKLARLGLATYMGGESWRLESDLATTLRRMGERGDIIRTMQREITARGGAQLHSDRVIFDPEEQGTAPLLGRVVSRGLADELRDRHFVIVDGVDGRVHYVDVGLGSHLEATPEGAIIRIDKRDARVRQADRTIVEVAAANGGRYSLDAHLEYDAGASEAFAGTHVRRLEAMRKAMRSVEREADGSWTITPDHLAKVEAWERGRLRDQPVGVELLSFKPVERTATLDGATWLDRDMISDHPAPVRDAGFGREVRAAQAIRRQWLLDENLAHESGGRLIIRRDALNLLARRELLREANRISEELGKRFHEAGIGERIEGRLARLVNMESRRHVLVERSRDFTLVPWRPVLDRHIGKTIAGTLRAGGIDWSLGRQRGGPSIS
ncbi:MAG: relaxase/mobilization nuclease and DUF3363 domain-containing protein [Sphingopyxis sp.]|uniref:relaxase/mobilization nuclease RlxS n=1 Tax=Sphingopyxis sp. TaxID=1908224 RepID=UPI001A38A502|nr:relaxase/mobilization nuclease RlxS [Sphingopyxis sp.]MBL9071844.1 relaxase/mobilization nuclease and DUF3363 domain-containing protein [Sphingopyxis sp.]